MPVSFQDVATRSNEPSGKLRVGYEEERRRLTRRRLRTACLLVVCIVPFYTITDYCLYPRVFPTLFAFRMSSVLLGLVVFRLTRRVSGDHLPEFLGQLFCVAVALANSAVPAYLLGYSRPYYVGFIIVILGGALLLPWRIADAAAVAACLVATYVGASLLHDAVDNWVSFVLHISFLGATTGIALVSVGVGEELRRREFHTRLALQDACNAKSALTTALADKTATLESLNQEMEDLLYAASHDLRAPLINVQGFSRELQLSLDQLRRSNGRSPEIHAALHDIDESVQFILTAVVRMDTLITSLLNVSRIATRTNPTQQVDLNSLARKLAESVHYQLAEKGIALTLDLLPVVTGDPVRLGQLFGNLIDNAIKYMGERRERRIHVGVCGETGDWRFFVRDTGPGIHKDHQEHVFRLFRRLANGNSPGEGIGLTMVRKIVVKHGGKIWVDSTPGTGTTFWFTLQELPPAVQIGGPQ